MSQVSNKNLSFNTDFLVSLRKNSIDLSELSMIANESQLSSVIHNNNNNNKNNNSSNNINETLHPHEPINYNLFNCFNNDLLTLGYSSSFNSEDGITADLNGLLKNGIDLIDRYNRQLIAAQRVKEECYRLDKENELLLKRQQTLKDTNESSNRELSNLEEKYRQLQAKCNTLTKTIKEQSDENRKFHNTIEQRDKQYKHDRKKLEKENDKLKERIQVLTTGKTKELPNLDISETLLRNSNAPRATWNLDGSKKQLDLYTELIKDYDRKTKELIVENSDLRSFISGVYSDLSKSLNRNGNEESNACYENENSFISEPLEHDDLTEQIIKLPFENIQAKLSKEFKSKFDSIAREKDPNSNLTISTIDSVTTTTTNNNDLLNTTITIEHKSDYLNDSFDLNLNQDEKMLASQNEFMKSKSIPLSSYSSSSSSSPSSTSPLADNYEQNSDYNNQQKESEETIKKEMQMLNLEKIKLFKEKKLFYEQKIKFENEASMCRKISNELNIAKKAFEEEQENYYQSKLYSSFVSQPNKKSCKKPAL